MNRVVNAASVVVAAVGFSVALLQAPAAATAVVTPCGNGTASSTAPTATCTYASSGAEDVFVVPPGVTSVHVGAVGGSGGAWSLCGNLVGCGTSGTSRGAYVTADLSVTPGATLYVEVAGNGGSTDYYGSVFGTGGFNGGADGGIGIGCPTACRPIAGYSGAGGGGASDVRTSPRATGFDTDTRLLVAAGGGGAAGRSGTGDFFGYTGGGGDADSPGANGYYGPGYGGGAGTATAGGAGGAGFGGTTGESGSDGTLGNGGAGGGTDSAGGCCGASGAGGGGGGVYGGGGGGSNVGAGGGGGGASFSGGSNVVVDLNRTGAAPNVVISYTPPAPVITVVPSTLRAGRTGSPYTAHLSASGGTAPYGYAVTGGSLPPGVLLSAAGAFSGVPTESGASAFMVTVTDAAATTATATYSLLIGLQITPATLRPGTYNKPYSAQLHSNGIEATHWDIIAGTLPVGLSLDPVSGQLTGTPSLVGQASFRVQVTDSSSPAQTGRITYYLKIQLAAPTALKAGKVGKVYTAPLTAVGGAGPYTWTLANGSLPDGLSLDANQITGTPTTTGKTTVNLTVTDSADPANTLTQQYAIVIK